MTELHLIVLDTETSGLDPQRDCIIEIAAVHLMIMTEVGVVAHGDKFHRFVIPTVPVSPEAAAVNGYSEEKWHLNSAVKTEVALIELKKWLDQIGQEGLMWAGSNVSAFDLAFLKRAFEENEGAEGMPGKPLFSHRTLNTESLCFPLLVKGAIEHCGLAALGAWAGVDKQRHEALSDAIDTCKVIEAYICREIWGKDNDMDELGAEIERLQTTLAKQEERVRALRMGLREAGGPCHSPQMVALNTLEADDRAASESKA